MHPAALERWRPGGAAGGGAAAPAVSSSTVGPTTRRSDVAGRRQRRVEAPVVVGQPAPARRRAPSPGQLRGALEPVVERRALGASRRSGTTSTPADAEHHGEDEHDAERRGGREGCASPSGSQDEPDAAHGVQHARLAVRLELAPQVADEDVGDVRPRVERVAPDLLVQPRAVEHLAGVAQEEREQRRTRAV